MAIVGSTFTKINIERLKQLQGKVNINNNIAITDVQAEDLALGKNDEKGMKFIFDFNCSYEPDVGVINLVGELLIIEKNDVADAILKSWEEKKQVPKDYMGNVLNAVLTKCNVQALILSQTMNLPPPIPLPKVTMDGQQASTETVEKEDKKPKKE